MALSLLGEKRPPGTIMIYSATTEYALRALAHMATLEDGERILARDLAAATNIPRQFLGKILHRLARLDLLDSAKGRGGGFRFAQAASDILVSDVVRAVEGGDLTKQCVLGLDECNDQQPCPMHDEWVKFRHALMERVYSMSVSDLGTNLKAKRLLNPTPVPRASVEDVLAGEPDIEED